jgi:hypothetical protein
MSNINNSKPETGKLQGKREAAVQRFRNIADRHQAERWGSAGKAEERAAQPAHIDINEEIARERKLRNDDAEQDIRLKRITINLLFSFLAAETLLIFVFALMQGTKLFGFHLEDWSFKLLVVATIAQITGMLYVAIRYLFPSFK